VDVAFHALHPDAIEEIQPVADRVEPEEVGRSVLEGVDARARQMRRFVRGDPFDGSTREPRPLEQRERVRGFRPSIARSTIRLNPIAAKRAEVKASRIQTRSRGRTG
jgi:hypothetical protein